jgi:hypothetical protein
MSSWVVVPNLITLRAEFDAVAPGRDRSSDGTIGDDAHQGEKSDHNPDETGATSHEDTDSINEVHALDVDASGPWPDGMTMAKAFTVLRQRMLGLGSKSPAAFLIYNRQIAMFPDWVVEPYTLADPHTSHLHVSSRYGAGTGSSNPENFTGPWGIEETFGMPEVDYDRIHQMIDQSVAGIFKQTLGDAAYPGRTAGAILLDLAKLRGVLVGDPKDTANAVATGAYEDTSPLARLIDAADVTLKPPPPPPAS